MQPNDYQQPVQYSADYLNSIAPQAPAKTINPFVLWGLIGAVLLLIVAVVLGVSSSANGGSSSSLGGVGAKLSNLKTLSEKAQRNLQSGELRSLNGSLTLILTNANRDIAAPLKAKEIKLNEPKENKSVAAVNDEFALTATRLEDARLNAIYDRTYAREVRYALKTLHSDMATLHKSTSSKSLKKILETTDSNLKPLLEGFENFNES